jgi:hypothetical protein
MAVILTTSPNCSVTKGGVEFLAGVGALWFLSTGVAAFPQIEIA